MNIVSMKESVRRLKKMQIGSRDKSSPNSASVLSVSYCPARGCQSYCSSCCTTTDYTASDIFFLPPITSKQKGGVGDFIRSSPMLPCKKDGE